MSRSLDPRKHTACVGYRGVRKSTFAIVIAASSLILQVCGEKRNAMLLSNSPYTLKFSICTPAYFSKTGQGVCSTSQRSTWGCMNAILNFRHVCALSDMNVFEQWLRLEKSYFHPNSSPNDAHCNQVGLYVIESTTESDSAQAPAPTITVL